MGGDGEAGAGVPDDGIAVAGGAMSARRLRRKEGGAKRLSRGEDSIGEIGLCHVGSVDRRGQSVHLVKGKSWSGRAAVAWRVIATEPFSFLVVMDDRRVRLRATFRSGALAPNISLSSNSMEGDSSSEGGKSGDSVLDQEMIATGDRNTTISLATEADRLGMWIGL
jgi:hypothetical protein